MAFFHGRDRYPEPHRLVWATFGLGVLSIPLAIALELPMNPLIESIRSPWIYGLVNGVVGAAIPEEFCKFLVLVLFCMRRSEFNEPMDGLVYGVAASMGFAATENLLYVAHGGLETAGYRAVMAVPLHGMTGAVMGYYLALARFQPAQRTHYFAKALVLPVLLHGLYDAALMSMDRLAEDSGLRILLPMAALAVTALGVGKVLSLVHRLRAVQLRGESEDDQPHHELGAYHTGGHRVTPWLVMMAGGLVLWMGLMILMGALVGGNIAGMGGALFPTGIGLVFFRRGIGHLNRLDAPPAAD